MDKRIETHLYVARRTGNSTAINELAAAIEILAGGEVPIRKAKPAAKPKPKKAAKQPANPEPAAS